MTFIFWQFWGNSAAMPWCFVPICCQGYQPSSLWCSTHAFPFSLMLPKKFSCQNIATATEMNKQTCYGQCLSRIVMVKPSERKWRTVNPDSMYIVLWLVHDVYLRVDWTVQDISSDDNIDADLVIQLKSPEWDSFVNKIKDDEPTWMRSPRGARSHGKFDHLQLMTTNHNCWWRLKAPQQESKKILSWACFVKNKSWARKKLIIENKRAVVMQMVI